LQSLREALRDFAGGWSNDLADGWPSALNGVQPNSDAVRDDLTFDPAEPIFPSRRGNALAGARAGQTKFDHWQAQGVLCLNAGLTLTRYVQGGAPEQLHGHLPFWQPIVGGVLRHLAARADGPIVFLLLRQPAQKLADAMGIRATAEAAGVWKQRVDEVRLTHPAAFNFLAGKNPFLEVDWRLAAMNGAPIGW
jgi:uracil DNA glycosylase